jgi:uncharacterized repeat protein (TIGR03803 family)
MDASGNIFGTTRYGGSGNCGTVFMLNASNGYALSTVVSFVGPNGVEPNAGVTVGADGNLYGTTMAGGPTFYSSSMPGYGQVFKLDASNNYALSTLAGFTKANGDSAAGRVIMDRAGNIYGTTATGGIGSGNGNGTVFKLDASNGYALATLADFATPSPAVAYPEAGLVMDAAGNLYGTTEEGGPGGYGTVFKLDASNDYALSILAAFDGADGGACSGGLAIDAEGDLFGTTRNGGTNLYGTVFELSPTPEPATLSLLVLGALGLLRRRK